jgi:DNA-binding NarL/FixJ family response regulator
MVRRRGFNLNLINDPNLAEQNFNPENYDLVLIGLRMSVVDGFDLYNKLHEVSKKVLQDTSSSNDFRICFMTSRINYQALTDIHPEFGEECYVSKEVPKDVFIKHVYSLPEMRFYTSSNNIHNINPILCLWLWYSDLLEYISK